MTETDMDLSELLATQDGGDFLRGVAEAVPQPIVEADGDGPIGAGRHERSADRARPGATGIASTLWIPVWAG